MAIKNPKTPRVPRKEKKIAKMYADKPTWAKEDAPGPIPGYKKTGGATKMKKYAMGGSALRPATDNANRGMYKTGGMVNANAKITAIKTPGSKGVKSGVNPKANAQVSAKGKIGGISKAPKDASPVKLAKAKMGGMKGKSC